MAAYEDAVVVSAIFSSFESLFEALRLAESPIACRRLGVWHTEESCANPGQHAYRLCGVLDALTLLLEWLNCDTFDGTISDLYRRSAVARDVIVSLDHRAATRLEIDRRTSQDKGPEGKKRERKQHSESMFEV